VQHGPAASSGSKTKAPGLSGGYLLVCASGTLCSDRSLAFFAFPGSGLTMTITDTFSIARATALNIYADLERS
jgi:hypothetical protein